MSLHPQHPIGSVPKLTARIARAAFPKSNPYLTLRDKLGTVFADRDFADLYPEQGRPGYPPSRLALVTLKTAWFMGHRIREAMRSGELAPFGGDGGTVEVDDRVHA